MRILGALFAAAIAASAMAAAPALAQTAAPAAAVATRLNPNTATAAQLATVPHLTPALVTAISAKKPFKTIGELDAILKPVLTPAQLAEVYPKLFVPVNLNTASEADINLIPGMTRRMVREFQEYKPYANIEQFNKEIGKYVSQEEVARLRSYVTLN